MAEETNREGETQQVTWTIGMNIGMILLHLRHKPEHFRETTALIPSS